VRAALPPFVAAVGLFVDAKEREIRAILRQVPLDLLQFHGGESPEFCGQFGKPYLRAVRMEAATDLLEYARRFSAARALLLDAHVQGNREEPDLPSTGRSFRATSRFRSFSPVASTRQTSPRACAK
jgi:phosphoribosylanthranilate isomerase